MTIRLLDAQCGFGGNRRGERAAPSVADCRAMLQRLDIAGALVRTAPDELEHDALDANARLFAACRGPGGLVPCPIAIPNGGGDVGEEEAHVAALVREGAGAVQLRPGLDAWDTAEWCCGRLLRALEARRLPAYCLQRMVPIKDVADLAARHPELPIILAETDYGCQRLLVPLLEAFGNVYLTLGSNYTVHRGLEQLVARVGARRLLFGTGFPAIEPMMAVTCLMYAQVADEEKALIGGDNASRLLAEVRR
jgi:predicted TIM-barrel fold metal-dependent hydrolase